MNEHSSIQLIAKKLMSEAVIKIYQDIGMTLSCHKEHGSLSQEKSIGCVRKMIERMIECVREKDTMHLLKWRILENIYSPNWTSLWHTIKPLWGCWDLSGISHMGVFSRCDFNLTLF